MGDQSNDDYLTKYRKFFEYLVSSVDPNDQLPVKVAGYNVAENEIRGEVADWALQYLSDRKCPPHLISPILRTLLDEIYLKRKAQSGDLGYRPQKDDYQSLKLMKAAINQLIDVCKRYLNNAQLSTLPSPPSAILQAPPVSACGVKNTRRTMEDRHIALQDLHSLFNVKDYGSASYYAVFDGHNGSNAATYSVSHLHQFLIESPYYPQDPITALQDAFIKTDDYFNKKCTEDGLKSGTTAVCCLLRPKEHMLYVAWAGDSQAVLVKHGVPKQIVKSHKPDRPDERKRIEGLGGIVYFLGVWRVNGQIAVSRAIGDQTCKPYIIAEPEIKAILLDGTEDFIILACDGLWDNVGEELAMFTVYNYLRDSPGDLEGVSQRLVQLAKEEGSTDNISVVVVFLSEPSEVVKRRPMETASPPNPFLKQNGSELYCGGSQNGSLRCFQDDEEEDFGPETDVDAVDDVLMQPSSIAAAKALVSSQNKELEDDHERQRQQLSDFDDPADADRSTNTPTPPALDVVGLPEADNVAESGGEGDDSDEEWNYIKGEEKSTHSKTKEELEEEMESQLNPDAPVFVPETSSILVHPKLNDIDISSSPMKGSEKSLDNVSLPTQNDFHKGIIECAGEFNRLNGVDVPSTEIFDEKHKVTSNHGDESEILSTKAEFGDDSAFSFSNSMNTSTAFSSGIPHDDENKGSSDMLFANENDFDPLMDAPKELQDLISSPEPDENLIPGTPHSTIAEASASPTNIDTPSSQFMDFDKIDEITKDEPFENVKTDFFFNEKIAFVQEQDVANEPQRPLTFAEVLKRPSPRTSPEPPTEFPTIEENKPLNETNPFAEEENKPLNETNPFAEEIKTNPLVESVLDVQSTSKADVEETSDIKLDTAEENIESSDTHSLDFVQKEVAVNSENDVDEEMNRLDNSVQSPFVTVRKSSVDDNLVEFDELKSPEDEKPPQVFQVDDSAQFYTVEQKTDEISHFGNFEQEIKASSPHDSFMTSLMNEKGTENLQFMSIRSEGSVNESPSDLDVNEVMNCTTAKNEQLDEVPPGDLQFGSINPKLEFNDNFNFNFVKSGEKETEMELKESNVVVEHQEFKVEENRFEIKPPVRMEEHTLDFNESHFNDVKSDILGCNNTRQSFETDIESKCNAQDVTLDTYSVQSELPLGNNLMEPITSPGNEFAKFSDEVTVDDLQKSFDYNPVLSKAKDEEFLSDKQFDGLKDVEPVVVLQSNEDSQKSNNPFSVEDIQCADVINEIGASSFEPSTNFVTESLLSKEFAEPIIEKKTVDSLSSELVKQQEEMLEQTINVDFIPAEPLASPEALNALPTVPKEEAAKREEPSETFSVSKTIAGLDDVQEEEPMNYVNLTLPPAEEIILRETIKPEESEVVASAEESSKGLSSTPPPTPAPGVVEQKSVEKEGLLAAAAAAAVAGAAATAGIAAAKTAVKKTTTTTAKKTLPATAPKKPTDLKTGTKTAGLKAAPKQAQTPPKPAASSLSSMKKPLSSPVSASKPAPKAAVTAKTATTATSRSSPATKPSTLASKPSTPPSKPTTPTSSSRPSSASKTSPTKPNVTARSPMVTAAAKPKPSTSPDKKPLTNGEISKTVPKKPDLTLASKKPLSTASKTSTISVSKAPATKTSNSSVVSKVGVSSAAKTTMSAATANKPKLTASKPATTLNSAAKAKLPAKSTDKTVKETVNKQISSTAPKVGSVNKTSQKTGTAIKKTEIKTLPPGKTAANNKPVPIGRKTTAVPKKEIKSEELTQDHIVTTTNGYTEELIENGVKLEKDSSPVDNNICDETVAAAN